MTESLTPHFSRKVLFLSLIFLLANLGIYALRNMAEPFPTLSSVAPVITSADPETIELRSPHDEDFRPAAPDQEVFTGTVIRTDEGESAEITLGKNIIRLDESTQITLLENNFAESGTYLPEDPRLVFELETGSIWVNAFDKMEVRSKRSVSELHHAVGIVTYSQPINRLMVVTGDADLSLLSEDGELLSKFVVPLHNQVTFVDAQLTDVYKALKPSKLKKELKMTPLSEEVLAERWVAENANDFIEQREAFQRTLIHSGLVYQVKSAFQKLGSYLTLIPEAKRELALKRADTKMKYILGKVHEDRELGKAQKLIESLQEIIATRKNDPRMQLLLVSTLYEIENAPFGSPAYLLREALTDRVQEREGMYVFRLYLTDLRRALLSENIRIAESIAGKWHERWSESIIRNNLGEFSRQYQILNHTILAFIDMVPIGILDIFDASGASRMELAQDKEETRFEVTSDRLQVAASLVSSYRYILAKQYLKNSYLSLNIEELSPDLASTQIFLENGRLLAQRIEYAENVLHGAAQPIDETKFREYFETKTRDEALSADLRKFFELEEQQRVSDLPEIETPTPEKVADRFLEARVTVNYADITRLDEPGFVYAVKNARLLDRDSSGRSITFSAKYDYNTNSVTNVSAGDKTFVGGFVLPDLVLVLLQGDELALQTQTTEITNGIDLLITDNERAEALEGQAIAQDVARQIAFEELSEHDIIIPEVKFNIEILDTLNLDQFRVSNALVLRPDEGSITINFDYNSKNRTVTKVTSDEGVTLIDSVPVENLAEEALSRVLELEKELEVISGFNTYLLQNELTVDPSKVVYTSDGFLALSDLRLNTLALSVSGLFLPDERKFITVSHDLYSAEDIELKTYFEQLADAYIINYLDGQGIGAEASQIVTDYPFRRILLQGLDYGGYTFSFELDVDNSLVKNLSREGAIEVIPELSLEEFKAYPDQLREIEEAQAAAQAAEEEAEEASEELPTSPEEI